MSEHTSFLDKVVLAAIAANTGVVLWGVWDDSHEAMLEVCHNALLAFFSVEVAIRIGVAGRSAIRDRWLVFDTLVIGVSMLPLLGEATSVLRVARVARMVHLIKHISHLRMVRFIVGFQRRCDHCYEYARWWQLRLGRGHVVGTCCHWWFQQPEEDM